MEQNINGTKSEQFGPVSTIFVGKDGAEKLDFVNDHQRMDG